MSNAGDWKVRALVLLAQGVRPASVAERMGLSVWSIQRVRRGDAAGGGQPTVTRTLPPPPDQPPPAKRKLTSEEHRARRADRLTSIRLRMAIGRELDDRGITTPAAIGEALGMPADEAVKLLTRCQWREDGVSRLEAVAARLGVEVQGQ
jgi:hypothetical protein